MRIVECRTGHMKAPFGFAMDRAVVSWIAESGISKKQVRACVVAASDPRMKNVIHRSDAQDSPVSTGFCLTVELKPRTAYRWTVQVWRTLTRWNRRSPASAAS